MVTHADDSQYLRERKRRTEFKASLGNNERYCSPKKIGRDKDKKFVCKAVVFLDPHLLQPWASEKKTTVQEEVQSSSSWKFQQVRKGRERIKTQSPAAGKQEASTLVKFWWAFLIIPKP